MHGLDDDPRGGPSVRLARRARRLVLPGLLAVLLLVLVGTATAQARDRGSDAVRPLRPADIGAPGQDPDGLAGSAVLVARAAVTALYRIDYRHAKRDLARLGRLATPEFADRYDAGSTKLRTRVVRQRVVSAPRLTEGGTATEFLSAQAAQVLVVVDVATARRGVRLRPVSHRTRVYLRRADDAWQVAGIDEVER